MGDDVKSVGLTRELLDYVVDASGGRDPIAEELAAATRNRFGDLAAMNIETDQGRFMQFLVTWAGAATVVEVGTFTGMSALFLARGLPAGGRLICCDVAPDYVDVGRPFWERAGVADRIEVRLGPAADTLAAMPDTPHIDLAFIDADKGGYGRYLDLLLPRLSARGLVLVDNVLWSGRIVDPEDRSADTESLRAFNRRVRDDVDLDAVMLSVGDGLTLIRRR